MTHRVDTVMPYVKPPARDTVVDRVALFGELGFEYNHAEGFQGKQAALRTFPIGIVVFLK